MRQFLRFRKWSFATISTCGQFLHFLSSECVTILAQCNFHTISRPDMRLRGGKLFYIPGTGTDIEVQKNLDQKITPAWRSIRRKEATLMKIGENSEENQDFH